MEFRAILELGGKTATGMQVPDEIVTALGSGKRPPVRVTIGDYTYRTSVAPMSGAFYVGVSAEVRTATGVKAGDEIAVEIELDTEPRVVVIPDDLAAALEADPKAKAFFGGLSYSNRRRFVLQIEGAKIQETRQRRIAKTVEQLRNNKV